MSNFVLCLHELRAVRGSTHHGSRRSVSTNAGTSVYGCRRAVYTFTQSSESETAFLSILRRLHPILYSSVSDARRRDATSHAYTTPHPPGPLAPTLESPCTAAAVPPQLFHRGAHSKSSRTTAVCPLPHAVSSVIDMPAPATVLLLCWNSRARFPSMLCLSRSHRPTRDAVQRYASVKACSRLHRYQL